MKYKSALISRCICLEESKVLLYAKELFLSREDNVERERERNRVEQTGPCYFLPLFSRLVHTPLILVLNQVIGIALFGNRLHFSSIDLVI